MHVFVRQHRVLPRRWVYPRVGLENPVHFRCLKEDISTNFGSTERSSGICCEERIAGTRTENNDASLFEVTNSTPADIWLTQLRHFDSGLNTCVDLQCFESTLGMEGG